MSAPIASQNRSPSVAVIVTAYNYGHFLESCLESIRHQTDPPDEVIVVDDGSIDQTQTILQRQSDFRVIRQENLGQAAAFNAGFSESQSEVVLFLDADDRLKPQALARIRDLMTEDVSGVCFDLEMIDRDGRPAGRYDMRVPEIDLLPRLLRDLAMPFMPTSGNAFRRKAIEWAFPLPEAAWKVSADAVLIRAAVYAAPVRPLPLILGEYRIHLHNNWFRSVAAGDWMLRRGHHDIARTGLELVRLAPNSPRGLNNASRIMLLFAGIKSRIKADELSGEADELPGFLKEAGREWPKGARLAVLLLLMRMVLPRSRVVRNWAIERSTRPALVDGMLNRLLGKHLVGDMEDAQATRPPFRLSQPDGRSSHLDAFFSSRPWTRRWNGAWFDLCMPSGSIRFLRNGNTPANLAIDMEPPGENPVHVTILYNGVSLSRFELCERTVTSVPLQATSAIAPELEDIEIRVVRKHVRWRDGLLRPCCRLRVFDVEVREMEEEAAPAVIAVGTDTPFSSVPGAHRPTDGSLVVSLASPPIRAPYDLSMRFGPDQAQGTLTITVGDQAVYLGSVGPNRRLLTNLRASRPIKWPARLEVVFRPESLVDPPEIDLAALAWHPRRMPDPDGARYLDPGRWVGFSDANGFLLGPWETGEGIVLFEHTAGMRFAMPPAMEGKHLTIDIGPVAEPYPDAPIALVVSVNGERAAAVRLDGRDTLSIPVGTAAVVEIGIHAARSPEDGTLLPHGGLELFGFGLEADTLSFPKPVADVPEHVGLRLGTLSRDELASLSPTRLIELRDAVRGEIEGLASRALEDFLTPEALATCAEIGRRVPGTPVESLADDTREWLRSAALAMLEGPAWYSVPGLAFGDIPRVVESYADVIGTFICAPFADGVQAPEQPSYDQAMSKRLGEMRAILAGDPERGARYRMACSALRACDCRLGGVDRAFAPALETRLIREGQEISAEVQGGGYGRIGVLSRHQNAICEELLRGFGGKTTLLLTDETESNQRDVLALGGQPLNLAVSTIRERAFDAVYLADQIVGCDPFAEISAHRLAPRQQSVVPHANAAFRSMDAQPSGEWFEDGEAPDAGFLIASPASKLGDPERDLSRARLGLVSATAFHLLPASGCFRGCLELALAAQQRFPDAVFLCESPQAVSQVRMLAEASGIAPERLRLLSHTDPACVADYSLIAARSAEEGIGLARSSLAPGTILFPTDEQVRRARAAAHRGGFEIGAAADPGSAIKVLPKHASTNPKVDNTEFCDWLRRGLKPNVGPPRYLFHHMPKTGGTSLRNMLGEWFDVRQDYREFWGERIPPPVDLSTLTPDILLFGHYGTDSMPLAERYPETLDPERWRLITFIRDPLEQALSWYAFEKQSRPERDPDFQSVPLDDFLEEWSGFYLTHFECGPEDWMDALDRYWFIGTVERFDASLECLARELGRPPPSALHYHKTPNKERPSPSAVADFAARMALEFEIYREVNRRLALRLGLPDADDPAI